MNRMPGYPTPAARLLRYVGAITVGLVLGATFAASAPAPALAAEAENDTLILVNGDPITSGDMDRMIMNFHRTSAMDAESGDMLTRLLEKRVNDLLILQDAVAMGMENDPGFLDVLNGKHEAFAIQNFLAENYVQPMEAHPDSMRAFFERYYWKIQIRQLSVRTREQAEEMRSAVLAGNSMDELARAVSVDSRKLNGGLHNLIHWADLENVFRDQVRGIEPGQVSEVFPLRDAFCFVRVEKQLPLDESEYGEFESFIRSAVLAEDRMRHRDAYFEELRAGVEMIEHPEALAPIHADSNDVLLGTFLKGETATAIEIKGGPALSAGKLRDTISGEAMKDGTAPFAKLLATALRVSERRLLAIHAARQAGYFDRADAAEQYDKDWEEGLLQGYLAETITDRIVFSREEFDEYYERNKERFRGPNEVRLDILILQEEDKAREAAKRLAEGADFGFIWQQYHREGTTPPGKAKFVKESLLSEAFRNQLVDMEPGDASEAVEMPMGWMVFVLDDRRPGALPSVQDMELGIRQALFEKEFRILLDEHLGLLKERSDIRRWSDRIEAYFNPVDEGNQ